MYVKLPSGDLNPDSFLLHLTSTYICEVTITSRVYGDYSQPIINSVLSC